MQAQNGGELTREQAAISAGKPVGSRVVRSPDEPWRALPRLNARASLGLAGHRNSAHNGCPANYNSVNRALCPFPDHEG